jgi:hypothetical protein
MRSTSLLLPCSSCRAPRDRFGGEVSREPARDFAGGEADELDARLVDVDVPLSLATFVTGETLHVDGDQAAGHCRP